MSEYLLILEHGLTSWGAYCPDIPGCIAVAETKSEAQRLYEEAVEGWVEATLEDGDLIPPPAAETDTVTIALAGQPPHRYLTILQPTPIGGWSVSAADMPDLVLEFSTRAGALRLLQTALQSHLETILAEGEPIPEPASESAVVSVRFADLSVAA
jgi:predicted RNase H-like HicB family nuclease